MIIFDKIGSKYTIKRTKLHQFKKNSPGACRQTPLAKRMAKPCAACRFATFPNLKKIILAPPLSNPGYAPDFM